MRQFGGDRGMIGRSITLDNTPVTVIGVLPETFDFGAVFSPGTKVDIFVPVVMEKFVPGEIRGSDWKAEAWSERGAGAGRGESVVSQVLLEQEGSGVGGRLYVRGRLS